MHRIARTAKHIANAWGSRGFVERVLLAAIVLAFLYQLSPFGESEMPPKAESVPGELLVRFEKGFPEAEALQMHNAYGATVVASYSLVDNLHLLELPAEVPITQAIEEYEGNARVLYAEPNYIYYALPEALAIPNDPSYSLLWGMDKIDAPEAWNVSTGGDDVVVFVIDTGGDYDHEDLSANCWTNSGEIPGDGIDNDGNGYIDDIHGIDACNNDSDPMDDHGHGTHISGTIGAVGDNAVGVAGVNWQVRIGLGKFLNAAGSGSASDAIECLEYILQLKNNGVNVVATNNSWGGGSYSQAVLDAIAAHREAGILFVAAAGNSAENNDETPQYPSSYRDPGIIAVASTTDTDQLSYFSCYGHRSVDLGAPGSGIFSTEPGDTYDYKSGTSMAAPHVTGAIALLAAHDPSLDWRGLRNRILSSGDSLATLDGNTVTGKRLNVHNALSCLSQSAEGIKLPLETELSVAAGDKVLLEYLAIECSNPVEGPITVSVGGVGSGVVLLRDDGVEPDLVAGDGLFAENWGPPPEGGQYTLEFPDAEVVTINVASSSEGGYEYSISAASWRDFSGANIDLADDDVQGISLPFPIDINGAVYNALWVQSNGGITTESPYLWLANIPLPDSRYGVLIVPWWDDLMPDLGTDGNVFWGTVGSAPNREIVIEWRNVRRYGVADSVRFQVVFPEADSASGGRILFQYADVSFTDAPQYDRGLSATIGIQVAADVANMFSYNAESLSQGLALLWTLDDQDTPAAFRVDATGDVRTDQTIYATAFQSGSADVAEWVCVSEPVDAGDVLELDPVNPEHYRKSTGACSSLIAGIVSTEPGFMLGGDVEGTRAALALAGIVPVKVCSEGGAIGVGDLLVAAGMPGYARRASVENGESCPLIGKALQEMNEQTGTILVLLMR